MKIVSYNVNGIRAALRKDFDKWLQNINLEVICLQEIKAKSDQLDLKIFEDLGFYVNWFPAQKKGYSGTAILSKEKPQNVIFGCKEEKYDDEGRIIQIDFKDFSQISVYIPSGTNPLRQGFKMEFLEFFQDYVNNLKQNYPNLIISGDFNICNYPIDIHDPIRNKKSSGFLPEERQWLTGFFDSGFVDSFRYLHKNKVQYSWWSYRANARKNNKGWRIDYNAVSNSLKDRIKKAEIWDKDVHSDHCPIFLELD